MPTSFRGFSVIDRQNKKPAIGGLSEKIILPGN